MNTVNVKKLLRITWLFAILTMVTLPFVVVLTESISPENFVHVMLLGFYGMVVGIFGILSVGFLNGIRSKLSPEQKKPFLILLVVSGLLLLIASILPLDKYLTFVYYDTILAGLGGVFVLSSIYSITCYLNLFDNIFLGLFTGIVLGLVLNRFGIEEAGFIVGFCFFLSFYGFFFLGIMHSKKSKENRSFRRLISAFCYVNCFIFLLLFFKFSSEQPAFTRSLDAIGVILFLLASIALFISLPFSNFVEWLKSQRKTFYKVILLPLLFFLVIFSLTFLLPDSTYRKIFFIEFSTTEKVHFGMDDYESDID